LIVLLIGCLIAPGTRRGVRFFLLPVALQLLWVNLHASFYLGPLIVLLFFLGEWLNNRMPQLGDGVSNSPVEWKRVGPLLLLMVAVSFVNPTPIETVLQPLSAENRELMTRYTLEWRSPFDPAMRGGAFHPYYEFLLAITAIAFALAGRSVRLSSLLLVGFFAVLSLKAHRFRVEFALVALPLVLDQLRAVPLVDSLGTKLRRARGTTGLAPFVIAVVASILLVFTARDRVEIGKSVSDRFPNEAFRFARDAGVAKRSFHTIGFGSYLIWELYPERQAFIDGRNLSPGLHEDFLTAQTNSAGFNGTIRKYDLDAFVLPVPERSDGGITNVHHFLIGSNGWSLVHIDANAYVYVMNRTVPESWLQQHAYRLYHPLTFARLTTLPRPLGRLADELTRAQEEAPQYVRVLLDSGRFYGAVGEVDRARALVDRALALEPSNDEALSLRALLASPDDR
jgi:hypothetical protein